VCKVRICVHEGIYKLYASFYLIVEEFMRFSCTQRKIVKVISIAVLFIELKITLLLILELRRI